MVNIVCYYGMDNGMGMDNWMETIYVCYDWMYYKRMFDRMVKETKSFSISYSGYELASSVCAVIFITLVLLDVWKAFRRKASWIPGKALALSALTIQLLLFSDHLDVSITSSNHLQNMQLILLVEEQLLIDSRRVMIYRKVIWNANLMWGSSCQEKIESSCKR
jgi:hypothetical protein